MNNSKKNISTKRDNCRLCLNKDIKLAVAMGESPISEKYVKKNELNKIIPKVPIDLYFCQKCNHLQMLDVINPEYLWADFTFKTSRDPKLIKHFSEYSKKVLNIHKVNRDDLIFDIGSNDGSLLSCFKDLGYQNVLGIDPASEIVTQANENGIKTIDGYLNIESSKQILEKYGKPKIITANNVFAHVDDLRGMLQSIKNLMDKDTIYVFEVSYLLDVIQKMLIGTIFHEHLSYHSVTSLKLFLNSFNMQLIRVDRGPEQGGSIVCYVKLENPENEEDKSVKELLELEKKAKLDNLQTYIKFSEKLDNLKNNLRNLVKKIKKEKKIISGFGAARAGTTFLTFFGIGQDVSKLYDDNKEKHFKFSPGDQIEVLPTKNIEVDKPDYLIILAWIHAEKIIDNYKDYMKEGGSFIKFYPSLEIKNK